MKHQVHTESGIENGDVRLKEIQRLSGPLVTGPARKFTPEVQDYAERWGVPIGLHCYDENPDAAIATVHRAIAARKAEKNPATLDTPLVDTLDLRVANALEQYHGCLTVGDAKQAGLDVLALTPNMGEVHIEAIAALLTQFD